MLVSPLAVQESEALKKYKEVFGQHFPEEKVEDAQKLTAMMSRATAFVEEALILSLLQDQEVGAYDRSRKIHLSLQKLDKLSGELGNIKEHMHPAILKEANRCLC